MKKRLKLTKQHKEKIRQSQLGHIVTQKTRKKLRQANLGKKRTGETREKLRQAQLGQKMSEESKEKNRQAHLGIKQSKETKEKNRQSHSGEKNWNWQGGISFEPYSVDWTDDLRDSIRKRDSYICQECGIHQDELDGFHKKLDIHHKDYDKKNCNPKNLISLCRSCHLKTNSNREYWIKYFK